jgi:hypothetical protein
MDLLGGKTAWLDRRPFHDAAEDPLWASCKYMRFGQFSQGGAKPRSPRGDAPSAPTLRGGRGVELRLRPAGVRSV